MGRQSANNKFGPMVCSVLTNKPWNSILDLVIVLAEKNLIMFTVSFILCKGSLLQVISGFEDQQISTEAFISIPVCAVADCIFRVNLSLGNRKAEPIFLFHPSPKKKSILSDFVTFSWHLTRFGFFLQTGSNFGGISKSWMSPNHMTGAVELESMGKKSSSLTECCNIRCWDHQE